MKCPVDETDLVSKKKQGIEIDYCPTCHGIWLNRGELNKIIEKSVPPTELPEPAPPVQEYREPYKKRSPRVWREPYREAPPSRGKRYAPKNPLRDLLLDLLDLD